MTEEALEKIHTTLQYLLAAQYTRRYQEIVMRIPQEILFRPQHELTAEDWKGEVASVIHAYIDLCAEEHRLYCAGQIPEEVWKNWEQGIQAGMRLPVINSLWNNFFRAGPYDALRRYLDAVARDS